LQNLNNFTVFGKDYNTPDGTCIRDYVHVEDVANAHQLAAEYLNTGGKSETFNLGTGVGYSIKEIIALIEHVTGEKVTFQFGDKRPGDPPYLVADISFAKTVLQYRPEHDIISIIKTAYNWEKRDRDE
jgi:UDP-glucose 4-epimerase